MRCCAGLLVLLTLVLMGCAGRGSPPVTGRTRGPDAGPPAFAEELPPLPDEGSARHAAAVQLVEQDGIYTFAISANTSKTASAAELIPGPGEVSYAIYELRTSGNAFETVELTAAVHQPDSVWYGISDYQRGSWHLVPATVSTTSVEVPAQPVSPDGYCYFAVIAFDGNGTAPLAEIQKVAISLTTPDWEIHTIDKANSPGRHSALVQVNQRFYVVYTAQNGDLRLARALIEDPADPAHWVITTAYTNTNFRGLDIASVGSLPALAWIDDDNDIVWYMRTDTLEPAGSEDWVFNGLEAAVGPAISLVEIHGSPALAYTILNGQNKPVLRYAYASKLKPDSGLDWTATDARISNDTSGGYASLDLKPGESSYASIAYYDGGTSGFYFAQADKESPTGISDWITCRIADTHPIGGNSISLNWLDTPLVAYTAESYPLTFAKADVLQPTSESEWTKHIIDIHGEAGATMDQTGFGILACYFERTSGDLRGEVRVGGLPMEGRDWQSGVIAAGIGDFGDVHVVTGFNGQPLVVYYYAAEGELLGARLVH